MRKPSIYATEQQYRTLADENARLANEVRRLEDLQHTVDKARACVGALEPDIAQISTAVADLKKAYGAIKAAPMTTLLGRNRPISTEFNEAVGSIFRLNAPSFECVRGLSPQFRPSVPGSVEQIVDGIIEAANNDLLPERMKLQETPFIAAINSLNRSTGPDVVRRSDLGPEDLAEADREIPTLTSESVTGWFNVNQEFDRKLIAALSDRIKPEIDNRQASIQQNGAKLADLDKLLVGQQSQQAAHQSLVFTIYGMIAALTLLFLSLRFFPEKIAERIIEDRSLVEVMSMAFILLTIIILGTGGKIGQETLGTLLGTIAGYIFGRKMAEGAKGGPSTHTTNTQREACAGACCFNRFQPRQAEEPGR